MEQPRRFNLTLLTASLALLLSLAIVGGLSYWYWQNKNALAKVNDKLLEQTHRDETNITQLNNTLADLKTQLQQQETALNQLQQIKAGDTRPWVFAEANYLMQLASYNLTFSRDIPAVIALLQTVDKRIASLNDSTLITIRQSLAKYITALQAVPSLDLAGLLSSLNALQEHVTQLPTRRPIPSLEKAVANQPMAESPFAWRRALTVSWETLQKLIIIRRTDQPVTPLLPQEQQAYLQQNLQLLLQQAQWAALHGQVDIYQNSLQQAKIAIQRYFATDSAATQAVIRTLNDLQKINLRPALPSISTLAQTIQAAANIAARTQN